MARRRPYNKSQRSCRSSNTFSNESHASLILDPPPQPSKNETRVKETSRENDQIVSIFLEVRLDGFVLVEKVNEPVDGIINAWEGRLKHDTPILAELNNYTHLQQEKQNLQLIRDTQTLWEGPLPASRNFAKLENQKRKELDTNPRKTG